MRSNHRPQIRATALALAAATICTACGTGPLDAPSKTSYNTQFVFSFDNGDTTVSQNNSLSTNGGLVITVEGTSLAFRGSYVYVGYPAGAGTMTGTINQSGIISLTQFGDPASAFGATLAFLQNNWPNCDFAQATPLPYSGSADTGFVSLTGGLTVPCTYTVSQHQTTLLTTMTETANGQQTGPPAGVLDVRGARPLRTSTRF